MDFQAYAGRKKWKHRRVVVPQCCYATLHRVFHAVLPVQQQNAQERCSRKQYSTVQHHDSALRGSDGDAADDIIDDIIDSEDNVTVYRYLPTFTLSALRCFR
jgi:hypothetical protein